jgi:hypothetical protein
MFVATMFSYGRDSECVGVDGIRGCMAVFLAYEKMLYAIHVPDNTEERNKMGRDAFVSYVKQQVLKFCGSDAQRSAVVNNNNRPTCEKEMFEYCQDLFIGRVTMVRLRDNHGPDRSQPDAAAVLCERNDGGPCVLKYRKADDVRWGVGVGGLRPVFWSSRNGSSFAAGKKGEAVAASLDLGVVKPLVSGANRLTLANDDTPTQRYGPQLEGAGVHHNPTSGPAGSPYVYGHVFVVLGLLAAHPAWGVVALPLLSRMYVRTKDLPDIDPKHRPEFRTKLELAVELLRWAKPWLGLCGKPLWVVADGAYAKKEFLKPALALGMTVVSRLRCDAALWSLPPVIPPDQKGPGRPRVFGTERISLAKRAGRGEDGRSRRSRSTASR